MAAGTGRETKRTAAITVVGTAGLTELWMARVTGNMLDFLLSVLRLREPELYRQRVT